MRVLFDNQIFKIQNFGGVSRYYAELIKGLGNSRQFESIPKKIYSSNEHLRVNGLTYFDQIADDYHSFGKTRIDNYLKRRDERFLVKTIRDGRFDVFHPTYYNPVFVNSLPPGKPFVLTVFDMIHELYLDEKLGRIHDETKYKKLLIPKAAHIVAISQNTKDDILHFFPDLDEKKITVIYLGSSFSASNASNARKEVIIPSKYILYVGNRNDYKNFTWFFKSVSSFLRKYELMLVCAGGGKFSEAEHVIINNEGLANNVKHFAIKDDSDLAALYKGASCFVFPSLYEGFGIPILEAFSCGCPVILPDSSCFPEIAENAALYYKNGDSESLVNQLERMYNDPELSQGLKEAGLTRLQFFNWKKTVDQHIEVYKSFKNSG